MLVDRIVAMIKAIKKAFKLLNQYDYKFIKVSRSMSKKGCSPDNSMGEGFFGTIKNEFFYSRDWSKYKCDDFIIELDKYLNWFKYKRIKYRLNKTII